MPVDFDLPDDTEENADELAPAAARGFEPASAAGYAGVDYALAARAGASRARKLPRFDAPDFDPRAAAEAYLAPDAGEEHAKAQYYAERGFDPVVDAAGRVVPRGTRFGEDGRADLEHLGELDAGVDQTPTVRAQMRLQQLQAQNDRIAAREAKRQQRIQDRLAAQTADAPRAMAAQASAEAGHANATALKARAELNRFDKSPDGKELKSLVEDNPDDAQTATKTEGMLRAAFDSQRVTGDPTPEAQDAQDRLARVDALRQTRDRLAKAHADATQLATAKSLHAQALADERDGVVRAPPPTPPDLEASTRPDVALAENPELRADGLQTPESLVRMKNKAADLQATLDGGAANLATPVRARLKAQIQGLNFAYDTGLAAHDDATQKQITDQTRDPTLGEKTESALANTTAGAATSLLDVPKFVGRQVTRLDNGIRSGLNALGADYDQLPVDKNAYQDFLGKMAETADSWGPDVPDNVKTKLAASLVTHDLAQGVGGIAGMLAPGKLIGRAGASAEALANVAMGGASASNKLRGEALAAGATPNQAGGAEAVGAGLGATLMAAKPLGDFVGRVMRSSKIGKLFGVTFVNKLASEGPEAAATFAEGAGKPMLQKAVDSMAEGAGFGLQQAGQTIGENAAASGIGYDPDRPLLKGADVAGASGFLLGSLTRALHESLPGKAAPAGEAPPTSDATGEPMEPPPPATPAEPIGAGLVRDADGTVRPDTPALGEAAAPAVPLAPQPPAIDKPARITEMLAHGHTPAQAAAEVGVPLADVHAVREARGIPSGDDPAALETWRLAQENAPKTETPSQPPPSGLTDVTPTEVTSEAAAAPIENVPIGERGTEEEQAARNNAMLAEQQRLVDEHLAATKAETKPAEVAATPEPPTPVTEASAPTNETPSEPEPAVTFEVQNDASGKLHRFDMEPSKLAEAVGPEKAIEMLDSTRERLEKRRGIFESIRGCLGGLAI